MKKSPRIFAVAFSLCLTASLRADPGPLSIWFTNAAAVGDATAWYQESLPIGNGKLAAMIYGGVATDQIQFNEDTIWCGEPHFYESTNMTPAHLASIRNNCFNHVDIFTEASTYMMSQPRYEPPYQAAGVLNFTFPHSGLANYKRSLNLSNATANIHYDYNGVTYDRDIFASAPSNHVIVMRFTASQTGKIAFSCNLTTLETATSNTLAGSDLVMHAKVSAVTRTEYYVTGLTNKVQYDVRVRMIANGGTVTSSGSSLSVTNADDVTLLLSVASNVQNYHDLSANSFLICSNNIAAAAPLGYATLRSAQLNDYQSLFNRVALDLGGNLRTNMPIGYRKKQIGIDGDDTQLVTLDFQLARYLMISGSRPGSEALNLQGKWNDKINLTADWDSKMTLNINEEMNYWGAEMANLSECHLPLFDLIQDLSVTGARVAGTNYYCNGWTAHHNTDLWRAAAAVNGRDGIWPTGGAWLCQHLWWHYQFTGDTNWLETVAYPLMKGAAQFFQSFLVTHPTYGWKVTCPSYSPEHDWPGSPTVSNIPGPTMDNDIIRDLFTHVIEASQILGVDATFRGDITTLKSQLPPDQVGASGQLQEWLEDVDGASYGDKGHRHCSHLVGFFPGDGINAYYTPTLAAAAKVSVDYRGDGNSSLTPWSIAWRINLRNRVQDGDRAFLNYTNLIAYSKVSTNLIFGDSGHRQLDAIFGRLSGIAEMFLQSHSGDVFLLPSLPSRFTNGSVSGLCARGGFVVDIAWQSNKLASGNILSKLGNNCRVRSRWPIDVKLGTNYIAAPMTYPGVYEFATLAGSNYTILPAKIFETENLAITTSAGDAHTTLTNSAFSNVRGTLLSANAAADFVAYTLTNIPAGKWRIRIVADCGTNRARIQLTGGLAGSLTNIGTIFDTYSATNVAGLYPSNGLTGQLLWTNMLKEFDCGEWTAPTNGNYDFKFSVVDKNASSSGYSLSFDHIKFTPVVVTPADPPILKASLQSGNVILSWPTNATGFNLESATNFPTAIWTGVIPAPVIVSTNNFVTNTPNTGQRFYRLHKP